MKVDPTFFRVRVQAEEGVDGLMVEVYNLDSERRFVGLEFTSISTTADRKGLSFPVAKEPTFRECLLFVGRAADADQMPRDKVAPRIRERMREVYGESARVEVEEITLSEPTLRTAG